MSRFAMLLALLAACRTGPAAQMEAPLLQDAPKESPGDAVKRLLGGLTGKDAYRIKFKATQKIGRSDDFVHKGEIWRRAKDVLVMKAEQSGGKNIEGVRVGRKIWQWNEDAEMWATGEDGADETLATGLQDPDFVAGLLAPHAGKARASGKDYELTLGGDDFKKIDARLSSDPNVDWTTASATVVLAGEKSLRSLSLHGTLKMKDGQKVSYEATIEVTDGEVKLSRPLPPDADKAMKESVK